MSSDHTTATVVADGLHFVEGPRWHDGALWFSDMHGRRVLRSDLSGAPETVVELDDDDPSGLGWLPDGRLLVVAMETQQLRRLEPDGSLVVHADLSGLALGDCNDMIVRADGTAYVGDMGYRIHGDASTRRPGHTIMVRPDGSAEIAAGDLEAPNGHVLVDDGSLLIVAESAAARLTAFDVAPDGTLGGRRVYAPLEAEPGARVAAPDGICLDAEGAVWFADPVGRRFCRVAEGGEITDVVRPDGIAIACVLGGPGRRTLLMAVAPDWTRDVTMAAPRARVEALEVAVGGAGRP